MKKIAAIAAAGMLFAGMLMGCGTASPTAGGYAPVTTEAEEQSTAELGTYDLMAKELFDAAGQTLTELKRNGTTIHDGTLILRPSYGEPLTDEDEKFLTCLNQRYELAVELTYARLRIKNGKVTGAVLQTEENEGTYPLLDAKTLYEATEEALKNMKRDAMKLPNPDNGVISVSYESGEALNVYLSQCIDALIPNYTCAYVYGGELCALARFDAITLEKVDQYAPPEHEAAYQLILANMSAAALYREVVTALAEMEEEGIELPSGEIDLWGAKSGTDETLLTLYQKTNQYRDFSDLTYAHIYIEREGEQFYLWAVCCGTDKGYYGAYPDKNTLDHARKPVDITPVPDIPDPPAPPELES